MLNKVNNRTMRGAFGDDTAGWAGKIIAMFPTMADNRGKMGPHCGCASRRRSRPRQQLAPHTAEPITAQAMEAAAAAACCGGASCWDPELEPDPVKPIREEMDDDIPW